MLSDKSFACVSLDAEPPWIQCPGDIVAGTDERRGTANISWNVPTATDNSNEEVGILKTKFGCTAPFSFCCQPSTSDATMSYLSFTRWQCRWNQFTLLLSFSPSERKPSPTSRPITQGTKLTARLPSLWSVSLSLQLRWSVFAWNVCQQFDTNKYIEHSDIKSCISLQWIVRPQELKHFSG